MKLSVCVFPFGAAIATTGFEPGARTEPTQKTARRFLRVVFWAAEEYVQVHCRLRLADLNGKTHALASRGGLRPEGAVKQWARCHAALARRLGNAFLVE